MTEITKSEILDYQSYGDIRPEFRRKAMQIKAIRRLHIGEHLTFLFENRETIKYQIQEMLYIEKIAREKDIQQEIDVYNELLGKNGALGCTMLIEIDDVAKRKQKLVDWMGLTAHLYMRCGDNKIFATYDVRQVGENQLSSVQYLKFPLNYQIPQSIGCDFEAINKETPLSEEEKMALQEDLKLK